MFSSQDLKKLIIPLFLEQLLMALAIYNAGAARIFHSAWHWAAYGRHRYRTGHVPGLEHARHHFLVAAEAGQMEDLQGHLTSQASHLIQKDF